MKFELPILETDRLILRKFEDKDKEDLYEYCSDPENLIYINLEPYTSTEQAMDRIDYLKAKYAEDDVACWAIEVKENSKMIGSIDFIEFGDKDNKAEIGYLINRKYWNNGYATEATKKLIEYGFENLGLIRIQAKCAVENIASARVMEKSNMKFEGIERKAENVRGKFHDLKEYAIIKGE